MQGKDIISKYLHSKANLSLPVLLKKETIWDVIVVIPAYREEHLYETLSSLSRTKSSNYKVLVIVILNYPSNTVENQQFHLQQFHSLQNVNEILSTSQLHYYITKPVLLQSKHAGVGLARKLGMDATAALFSNLHKTGGIIASLDGDCTVDPDYFIELEKYFKNPDSKPCVTIGFVHIPEKNSQAILQYELHLRYYIEAQKYIQYPFAYHTLGSCIAVTAEDYCAQGGMNQRQAGEDFYFLHKFSVIGKLGEIKKSIVFPSDRISDRVPFGTGKAMMSYSIDNNIKTYQLESILLFGSVLKLINHWFHSHHKKVTDDLNAIHPMVEKFFSSDNIQNTIDECSQNCSSRSAFTKRFMRWMNPFRLMKFLHFMRNHGFEDKDVLQESKRMYELKKNRSTADFDTERLLLEFRKMQEE